ncbi:MAG: bifunctional adenosylcobinamide kinase/adenosylcobinamide-phosphate guanylyltransferase [Acidobacteria bacterium]|nr:MAG: bifunctional adenosylcobinamide kinase/adenosylcobinamide-phosphate guanylyltransferase [Acidobacteriota bacterium]
MRKVTLITGGARSGKSRHALVLAQANPGRRAFVATAEPLDEEMLERIRRHREDRDPSFLTIEEPVDLGKALRSLPADVEVAVIDCLTVWLGNLMHCRRDEAGEPPELRELFALLAAPPCDLIIVTNEVGMGIVPGEAVARRFRDLAGRINQEVAKRADVVILMVSGIPIIVKQEAM